MVAASAISSTTHLFYSIASQTPRLAQSTQKVYDIGIKGILLLRQSIFFLRGPLEIFDGAKVRWKYRKKHHGESSTEWKMSFASWRVFAGVALLGSGVFGVASELITIIEGVRTPVATTMVTAANSFFFIASVANLKNAVEKYFYAKELMNHPATYEQGVHLQHSALMGIFANFNFIFGTALLLFGFATTLAVVICCVGTMTSCFIALHDWYYSVNLSIT